jgi:high affinity Mn2+ porin
MLNQIYARLCGSVTNLRSTLVSALILLGIATFPAILLAQTPSDLPPDTNQDAQSQTTPPLQPPPPRNYEDAILTVFPHSESSPFWISGQLNFIFQGHPSFTSPYQGPHSLHHNSETALSRVLTLYTGWRTSSSTEFLLDFESAGGNGISNAFGLAGYSNLDVVRNPELGPAPYVARGIFHAVLALGSGRQDAERNPLSLFTSLPTRRLEFRVGRFSLADFFDANSAGSDSHLQFMNWTLDNSGAYDYAADTRGYTVGAMLDFEDRNWSLRFAEALMPRVANGIAFQWNLERARAENIELELRPRLLAKRPTILRLLSYINHANMGDYRIAIQQFEHGQTLVPDVTNHPLQTTIKYGFGANAEQPITDWLTGFARFGWNEGRHESFAYTEVNQTVSFGAVAKGKVWRRKLDRGGIAFVSNALSGDHRRYLQLGGLGFLLGDGTLTYGREKIVEGFYTTHLWRGTFFSFDLQHVNNPGYNQARGPVIIPALRLHVEL